MENALKLYEGRVLVRFNPANHRYTVSTDGKTWDYKVGVTTILNKLLAKEALMLWPMEEALNYLFGQKFDDQLQDDGSTVTVPQYTAASALFKPGVAYSAADLQLALETARGRFTKKRDKGGDVGTIVHKAIETYLTTGIVPGLTGEAHKAFTAFVDWFKSQDIGSGLKVLSTEQVVYSASFDYCGTFDALLEIDGRKVLVDFKTANYSRTAPKGIYAEGFMQLGAYAQAYLEEFGFLPDEVMIVNCSKQGKVNVVSNLQLGVSLVTLIETFVAALAVYTVRAKLDKALKNV